MLNRLSRPWFAMAFVTVALLMLLLAAGKDYRSGAYYLEEFMSPGILSPTLEVGLKEGEEKLEERQQDESSQNLEGPAKKVMLFTHIRSGSTLLGEIFNRYSQATYWYEPWDGIYSSLFGTPYFYVPLYITHDQKGRPRPVSQEEKEGVAKRFQAMMSCDLNNMTTESLTHRAMLMSDSTAPYHRCYFEQTKTNCSKECKKKIENICVRELVLQKKDCFHIIKSIGNAMSKPARQRDEIYKNLRSSYQLTPNQFDKFLQHHTCLARYRQAVKKCLPLLRKQCNKTLVFSAKVTRATMEFMDTLFTYIPDLKVIHYVRDPRGTLSSRREVKLGWPLADIVGEAKVYCDKLKTDVVLRRELELKYPGRFLEVKYEEIAIEPMKTSKRIYNFLGMEHPTQVEDWLQKMNTGEDVSFTFNRPEKWNTKRENSTATAYAWQTKLKPRVIKQIDEVCNEVYQVLDYKPFS